MYDFFLIMQRFYSLPNRFLKLGIIYIYVLITIFLQSFAVLEGESLQEGLFLH